MNEQVLNAASKFKEVSTPITLYSKDSHNNIRQWTITGYKAKNNHGEYGLLVMNYGVVGGDLIRQEEIIEEGKQTRSLEEQIHSRINSRMDKKMQAGYVHSIDEAKSNKRVNKLGLLRPMTAKKLKEMIHRVDFVSGVFVQRKYNGYRCLVTKRNGEYIAYSRNGLELSNLNHIIDEIDRFKVLEEGETIDGELYYHNTPFQTISSWIKKNQPETIKIQYMIYDIMKELPFSKRFEILKRKIGNIQGGKLYLAPTFCIYLESDVAKYVDMFVKENYEGAILRTDEVKKYQDGKRSNSLIKCKKFHDGEFRIKKITPSKEGWAVLHCLTDEGKEFKCSAPGDMGTRFKIYEEREKYIGQFAHIQYFELTKDKVPFHGVAKFIRNPHSE